MPSPTVTNIKSVDTTEMVTPEAVSVATQAFADFNAQNRQSAIQQLRPYADRGEPWALGLLCFMISQQELQDMRAAIPLAKKAGSLGMPWVAANFFNQLMNRHQEIVETSPSLLDDIFELGKLATMWAWGNIDPVAMGWNLLAKGGQDSAAVRIMNLQASGPVTSQGWTDLVTDAKVNLQDLIGVVATAEERKQEVESAAEEATDAFSEMQSRLEARAVELELLLDRTTAEGVQTLYEQQATKNAGESKTAWGWGLVILTVAAAVGVLPVVLHYLVLLNYVDTGPTFTTGRLLLAHLAATAALATVAGVLLARARGRDHAQQRATDLATAMGTMIVYSNQIQDPTEKQVFIQTMGHVIFQAGLRFDSPPGDDSAGNVAALISALRSPKS